MNKMTGQIKIIWILATIFLTLVLPKFALSEPMTCAGIFEIGPEKTAFVPPKSFFLEMLSTAEVDAFRGWTQMPEDFNKRMRASEPATPSDSDGIKCSSCKLLWEGLRKLPSYKRTVYRGAELDTATLQSYLIEGNIVYDHGFMSASRSPGIARSFLFWKDPRRSVFMIINSKQGKSIEKMTGMIEKEVLFQPNSKFKITKVQLNEDGTHTVYLDEVTGLSLP